MVERLRLLTRENEELEDRIEGLVEERERGTVKQEEGEGEEELRRAVDGESLLLTLDVQRVNLRY